MKKLLSSMDFLKIVAAFIAICLCLLLLAAAAFLTYKAFVNLFMGLPQKAIVDALFVVIVIELFYVIRSFTTRGSVNAGLIINVAVIATVKELIFKLDALNLQLALAFGVIFISLGVVYLLEVFHFERKKKVSVG